jgi:tetratricopeptide (TPR) repeat protein
MVCGLAFIKCAMLCAVVASAFSEPATAQQLPASAPAWLRAAPAESLAAWGRTAARRNDNATAAAYFWYAMARAPSRRLEWLREYADQLTYAGSAAAAVPLYQESLTQANLTVEKERRARLGLALALSWGDELERARDEYDAWLRLAPYDVEAHLGRARVLSWISRNGAAKRAYERALFLDPDNLEAQRNLARVQSWRSKHRDAQRRLEEHVRRHPDDSEAALFLAQSQTWLGRPDRATSTLEDLLAREPENRSARQLQSQLRLQLQPSTSMRYDESHQSDDLAIRGVRVVSNWTINDGLTSLGPRFVVEHYDPKEGAGITTSGIGAFCRHRFRDALEWTTWMSVDRLGVGENDHVRLTYDTYVTLWPNDVLRFDAGSSRTALDNVRSLQQNIVATYLNLGADVLPNELTRFAIHFNWGDYGDGNQRIWDQLIAEFRLRTNPHVVVGLNSTAFRFSELEDNGYFNPREYVSNGATVRLYNVSGQRFWFDFGGMAGAEHPSPGEDHFIWSLGVQLRVAATSSSSLLFHANHYSSATASSSGFARSTFGIAWRAPLF